MKIERFEDRWSWLEARRGKITGTKLHDVITYKGHTTKIGVYELMAERLGVSADGEDPAERGHRLEPEALKRFQKETGKKLNTEMVIWSREEEDDIAISPDGFTDDLTEAVDVKCLSSPKHLKAYFEKKLPEPEYEAQALQYFIVNEKLQRLYFAFFDPRLYKPDFFFLTIERKDKLNEIDHYHAKEAEILAYVREKVNELSF